ncbi:head GIN domain-containing protein [Sediminicola arcticus]|uniref:Head GIN domain-containing protein n=1 Tax=Sediminicola arcticus TaxID=1574308 RepID=A0ABV2SWA0_9FLAO
MRTSIVLIAITLLSWNASAQKEVAHELYKFSEVKAYDGITVKLISSDVNKAVITGDYKSEVAFVNKSGRLKIRMELDNFLAGHNTTVMLYHTETLVLLDVNEKAKIVSDDVIRSVSLEMRAQEGGELQLKVEAEKVDVKATTGGIVSLSGTSKVQDISVNTGGVVKNESLKTEQTEVSVNAGGTANVNATDIVDAKVRAGGTINIYGNPKEVKETKFVGGNINSMN